jgi:hypothetical protein
MLMKNDYVSEWVVVKSWVGDERDRNEGNEKIKPPDVINVKFVGRTKLRLDEIEGLECQN